MRYLLGIDNGGTVIKAAAFDLSGNQAAGASARLPFLPSAEGFTERNPEDILATNAQVVRNTLDDLRKKDVDAEILSVGICGHGKGLYLLGENNTFLYRGIASTDNRAVDYEVQWNTDGTTEKVYPLTAQKIMACQPCALLRWLKENNKQVYDQIRWVLSAKDFVRFLLTGQVFGEYTDMSGTNLMNLNTRQYDPQLLELFGIPEMAGKLPPLKAATDGCGFVTKEVAARTGLKEGTPVAGGMFDIDACAVAMGNIHPGDMCTIAGTWSINEFVSTCLLKDKSVAMNSIFFDPTYYLAEESSAASAGNLEWVRDLFKGKSYEEINSLVSSVKPEDSSVWFLPFLYASNENPYAKAAFIGLQSGHGEAHLFRAVFEGVAFSHRRHLDKLKQAAGQPKVIRLAGGVCSSPLWVQLFADVLNTPMAVIHGEELGAKGAAMAAGVAAGVYQDCKDAVDHCVQTACLVYPDPRNVPIYEKKYRQYRTIIDALDGVWDTIK